MIICTSTSSSHWCQSLELVILIPLRPLSCFLRVASVFSADSSRSCAPRFLHPSGLFLLKYTSSHCVMCAQPESVRLATKVQQMPCFMHALAQPTRGCSFFQQSRQAQVLWFYRDSTIGELQVTEIVLLHTFT
jgi:hypothetical protein